MGEIKKTPAEWARELNITDPDKWKDDNKYDKDHFLFLVEFLTGKKPSDQ